MKDIITHNDLMTYDITVIIFVLMIKTRDKCYLQYYYLVV